jgi:DNA-directed RNA polymerase subunit RPC12/RpoP
MAKVLKITKVKASICSWSLAVNCAKCGDIVQPQGDTIQGFTEAMGKLTNLRCQACAKKP